MSHLISKNIQIESTKILVDSGSSTHICNNKILFKCWDNKFKKGSVQITLANGDVSRNDVEGVGDALLQVKDINDDTVNI